MMRWIEGLVGGEHQVGFDPAGTEIREDRFPGL